MSNIIRSGLYKPTLVPNKLSDFLGLERGTIMARTEVSKKLYIYIKNQCLQNYIENGKVDKRIIVANKEFADLFGIKKNQHVRFSTLQTLLSKLYNEQKTIDANQQNINNSFETSELLETENNRIGCINRDKNAVNNMIKIVKSFLINKIRPEKYRRDYKFPEIKDDNPVISVSNIIKPEMVQLH
jgi:hypothetical protein